MGLSLLSAEAGCSVNQEGTYDFLYVPCLANMQQNKTYAFINFTSHRAAVDFRDKWDKRRIHEFCIAKFSGQKSLNISFADVQGRYENLLQLSKKRCERRWPLKVGYGEPLIFDAQGERMTQEQALFNFTQGL